MNKNYVTAFGLLMAVFAVLYACKRTDGANPEQGLKNQVAQLKSARPGVGMPKVNLSWLQFQSLPDFQKAMEQLHTNFQNPNELNKWEDTFRAQGFISLRKFYELNDADTSESRRALTTDSLIKTFKLLDCPDSWFATVLSKEGNIQIGDTVYCFRPNNKKSEAYAVPAKHAPELASGISPLKIYDMVIHPTFENPITIKWPDPSKPEAPSGEPICKYPSSGLMPQWWGQVGGDIYAGDNAVTFPEHNGRQVKLNYHRWRVGYIFYASTGARLKMLKHTRFAGWQSVTYADEMIMEACAKGKIFVPGLPLFNWDEQTSPGWPQFARYAENKFEKTMKWTASGLFNEIILEHFNFHFKVNYRGRIVDREVRQ